MELFDAHAHVQFSAFDADRTEAVARARAAGVRFVSVGTQIDTSRAAVALAEAHEGVYAAVGLHPVHTSRSRHDENELGGGEAAKAFTSRGEVFVAEAYRALAAHPKTVAIGECGLDYFRFHEGEPQEAQRKKQEAAFTAQIALAREAGKPLMIHCRNAFPDLIAILKERRGELRAAGAGGPGVIHFFAGGADDARELLALGFSFTFGGAVTFPPRKGRAEGDYDALVRMIPADRILSETDAPYVAPAPWRGRRNEPAYVAEVVKRLAELKGIPREEMASQIMENARRIFKIS